MNKPLNDKVIAAAITILIGLQSWTLNNVSNLRESVAVVQSQLADVRDDISEARAAAGKLSVLQIKHDNLADLVMQLQRTSVRSRSSENKPQPNTP